MKRFVSLKEASEIIEKTTGVSAKLVACENTAYDYSGTFDSPYFAPLKFTMTNNWVLDQQLLPVCPLQQVQPTCIAMATGMPLDAYFCIGSLANPTFQPDEDQKPLFHIRDCSVPLNNYFLVMCRKDSLTDAHQGYTGWQPLLPTLQPNQDPGLLSDTMRIWHATSATKGTHYWEFYLLPVGYCQVPIVDQKYHCNFYNGQAAEKILSPKLLDVITTHSKQFAREFFEYFDKLEREYEKQHADLVKQEQSLQEQLSSTCDSLNRQIDILRQESFFADLDHFQLYGRELVLNARIYKPQDAENLVAEWQNQLDDYRKYEPVFIAKARFLVNELGGYLNLSSMNYAEIVIPLPRFSTQEKSRLAERFRYTEPGVAAAVRWLKSLKVKFLQDDDTLDLDKELK